MSYLSAIGVSTFCSAIVSLAGADCISKSELIRPGPKGVERIGGQ
jgi:hypothetical protein